MQRTGPVPVLVNNITSLPGDYYYYKEAHTVWPTAFGSKEKSARSVALPRQPLEVHLPFGRPVFVSDNASISPGIPKTTIAAQLAAATYEDQITAGMCSLSATQIGLLTNLAALAALDSCHMHA